MMPDILTERAAAQLVRRGRARVHQGGLLTTPRAAYQWQDAAQWYERQETPAPATLTGQRLVVGIPLALGACLAVGAVFVVMLGQEHGGGQAPSVPGQHTPGDWLLLGLGTAVFLVLATLVYLLPTLVAGLRRHRQWLAIAVLNLCLGWTLLGWVGSLVWACSRTSVVRTEVSL